MAPLVKGCSVAESTGFTTATLPDRCHFGHRRRGRRRHGRAVRVLLQAERARPGARGAGRGRHQQARARRAREGRVARPADLHRAPHRGHARLAREGRSDAARPGLRGVGAAELRNERVSQRAAGVPRARGRLHAPRLRAAATFRGGAGRSRAELAGRLLLPLPWLAVRSGRPRVPGRSGADESAGAAVPLTSTTTRS